MAVDRDRDVAPAAGPGRLATGLIILGICEVAALAIALLMPITPSKTGGERAVIAKWFFDAPSYLQEVLVYFIMTNALLLLLAGICIWLVRRDGQAREEP